MATSKGSIQQHLSPGSCNGCRGRPAHWFKLRRLNDFPGSREFRTLQCKAWEAAASMCITQGNGTPVLFLTRKSLGEGGPRYRLLSVLAAGSVSRGGGPSAGESIAGRSFLGEEPNSEKTQD